MSDLISRKALIGILTKYKFGAIKSESEREYTKETVLNFVKEQSTVEAVPVVYGEWKNMAEHNDHLHCKCSICGFTTENYQAIKNWGISSDDYLEYKWNFCPKCGTRMRKKV